MLLIKQTNYFYPILIFLIFFVVSCNSKKDDLQNQISIALRNDNKIDETEWDSLVKEILQNKEDFTEYILNDSSINQKAICLFINEVASKRRNSTTPQIFNGSLEKEKKRDTKINIFIENSGSMDGYIKNATEFEAVLSDLLVRIQYKYEKDKMNFNFINSKIYPLEINDINEFISTLEPLKKPYNIGERGESQLNEIFKMVLSNTKKDEVSLFFSDCIYSLEANKDTEGGLEFQKSLTKGAFLEKSKEFGFSTKIVKMKSRFDGKYWDKNNKFQKLDKSNRPYYIWIIGRDELMVEFSNRIDVNSLKGFQNSFYLTTLAESDILYTILKETNKIGRFKPTNRGDKLLKSITDIDYKNGKLGFSIAVDLSKIIVDSTYLKNISNYSVTSGFVIKSIQNIDDSKVTERDKITANNIKATHLITVQILEEIPLKNLEIELVNKMPNWIETTNTVDDTDISIQLDKTFGLLHLIEGVSQAYELQNNNQLTSFYKLKINIK